MRCPICKRELPPPVTVCPHDGAPLLAPLSEALKRGPLSLPEATKIAERICLLLDPVHKAGRVHARITPDNVYYRHVGSELTVRLTEVDETRPLPNARYATPERVRGEREDPRADIYALGLLLHHMIAGQPPFDSGTEAAILKKHAETPPGALNGLELQDVPDELDSLIRGMLAKHPRDRPASVGEIRDTLENIDTGSTITGAKIASLGVGSTLPLESKPVSGLVKPSQQVASVLDEPTVETRPVFDVFPRDSQNPTLFNVDRAKTPLTEDVEHPTSLEVDPYGDTLLRLRRPVIGGAASDNDGDADTRLQITPRVGESPILPSGPPPTAIRFIEPSRAKVSEPAPVPAPAPAPATPAKPAAAPRGPTLRTEDPNRREQQTRLALMVLIAALVVVVGVLALVLITR